MLLGDRRLACFSFSVPVPFRLVPLRPGVPSMVVGSFASIFHCVPHSSQVSCFHLSRKSSEHCKGVGALAVSWPWYP